MLRWMIMVYLALTLGLGGLQVVLQRTSLAITGQLEAQQQATREALHDAGSLLVLTQDYMLRGTEQAASQWLAAHGSLARAVAEAAPPGEAGQDMGEWRDTVLNLPRIFERLRLAAPDVAPALAQALRATLADQILTQTRRVSDLAYRRDGVLFQNLRQEAASQRERAWLLTWLWLASSVLLAWLLVTRVLRPVALLGAAARDVQSGKLEVRCRHDSSDELGQLSAAFNAMTEALAQRQAALVDTSRRLSDSAVFLERVASVAGIGGWQYEIAAGRMTWTDQTRQLVQAPEGFQPTLDDTLALYRADARDGMDQAIAQVIETGQPFDLKMELRTMQGRTLWVRSVGMAERDGDGPGAKPMRIVGAIQDISEQVHLAQALAKATERLALAVESAAMGVWEYDLQQGTLTWDERMCALYGHTRTGDAEPYALWTRSLHPDDRVASEQALADAIAGPKPLDTQFRICLADGSVRHLKAVAKVKCDAADKALRVVGVNIDITEQVATSSVLQDKAQLLRRVGQLASIGGWRLDLQAGSLYWDEQTRRIHETPPGFLPDLATAIDFYAPEHREPIAQAVQHAIETGEAWDLELRLITCSGRSIWVRALGEVEHENQRAVALVGAFQDITERHEAEQKFRDLLESAPDAMVIADPGGLIVLVNTQAEKLFGYARAQMLGQPVEMLMPEPDRVGHAGKRAEYFAAPCARSMGQGQELRGRRQDGSSFPIEVSLSPLQTSGGLLVSSSIRDVTERHRAAQLLGMAKAAAESASAAKSAFLANMSHEIRTPLNAVIGVTYLLADSDLKPDQQQLVAKAQMAGRSLLGIVNDVLDLAKIESGEMALDEVLFQPAELLNELQAVYDAHAQSKGLLLSAQVSPETPELLLGDCARMRQILTNLIGNAVKFTEHGSVKVDLSVVDLSAQRARIRLTVRDTGIGISLDTQARLFQPFIQGDLSTTRSFGGTGLGLSIVRRLAQVMGGEVGLTSVTGQGSEFWVELPMGVPSAEQQREASNSKLEVLVVDDNLDDRVGLAAMTRSLGWRATLLESGAELLKQMARRVEAGERLPDALIVDWQMPGMDGLEALRALSVDIGREQMPAALVISAYGHEQIKGRDHGHLADQILSKPVGLSELFNAVNSGVARHSGSTDKVMQSTRLDAARGQWLPGVRVLLVDDSDIKLDLAQRQLQRQGAQGQTCTGGRQALNMLRDAAADLDVVLMDVQMPDMDGLEVTRQVRGKLGLHDLPIVALTAGALTEERKRALAAGMDDFLSKPLDPQGLVRTIRRLVERCRGHALPMVPTASAVAELKTDRPLALTDLEAAWPAVAGIDTHQAMLRLGGDGSLFASILRRLLADYADLMLPSREEGDAAWRQAMAARVHKLRGSAGAVGAGPVMRLASAAEEALRAAGVAALPALHALSRALQSLQAAAAPMLAAQANGPSDRTGTDVAEPLTPAQRQELADLLRCSDLEALARIEQWASALRITLGSHVAGQLQAAAQALSFEHAGRLLAGQD